MGEHDFQQEFIRFFRAAAPGYPQPVADYRLSDGKLLDIAWPELGVAVEYSYAPVEIEGWRIVTITPTYWRDGDQQRAIRQVRLLLDS